MFAVSFLFHLWILELAGFHLRVVFGQRVPIAAHSAVLLIRCVFAGAATALSTPVRVRLYCTGRAISKGRKCGGFGGCGRSGFRNQGERRAAGRRGFRRAVYWQARFAYGGLGEVRQSLHRRDAKAAEEAQRKNLQKRQAWVNSISWVGAVSSFDAATLARFGRWVSHHRSARSGDQPFKSNARRRRAKLLRALNAIRRILLQQLHHDRFQPGGNGQLGALAGSGPAALARGRWRRPWAWARRRPFGR